MKKETTVLRERELLLKAQIDLLKKSPQAPNPPGNATSSSPSQSGCSSVHSPDTEDDLCASPHRHYLNLGLQEVRLDKTSPSDTSAAAPPSGLADRHAKAETVRSAVESCWLHLPAFPSEATLDLMNFHTSLSLHDIDFDVRFAFVKGLKNNTQPNGTVVKIKNYRKEKDRWEALPLDTGWIMNMILGGQDEDGETIEVFEQNCDADSILLKECNVQQFSIMDYIAEVNRVMDALSEERQ